MPKHSPMVLLRFVFGFVVVAVTCLMELERSVWREQLAILLSLSALAGVICAVWPACARAIKNHWTF